MSSQTFVTGQSLRGAGRESTTIPREHKSGTSGVTPDEQSETPLPAWETFLRERENASRGIFGRCKEDERGCWNYTGRIHRRYGEIKIAGARFRVHRLVYMIFHGWISESVQICHSCDNPRCINPRHLAAGWTTENLLDMAKKGRARRKLTDEQVREIKARRAAGEWSRPLATEYGVSKSTIKSICAGRTWMHLSGKNNPPRKRKIKSTGGENAIRP